MTTVFLVFCAILGAGILLAGVVELAQIIVGVCYKPWHDVPPPDQETWRNEHSPRSRDVIKLHRRDVL